MLEMSYSSRSGYLNKSIFWTEKMFWKQKYPSNMWGFVSSYICREFILSFIAKIDAMNILLVILKLVFKIFQFFSSSSLTMGNNLTRLASKFTTKMFKMNFLQDLMNKWSQKHIKVAASKRRIHLILKTATYSFIFFELRIYWSFS